MLKSLIRAGLLCALLGAGLATVTAFADVAQPVARDPQLEARVTALTQELRCLVCQNQTIADSHADLAIDLKNQVREKLAQGQSEKEITDYMVQRYGDFVLYRPPMKSTTWLLWIGPFLILFCGIAVLARMIANRRVAVEAMPEQDMQHAAALLAEVPEKKETP
jgi:cytochrome c-type biogenesis protein CcmH